MNNKAMNKKNENLLKLKLLAYSGVVCMSIALLIQLIWIGAFNAAETHVERVGIFNNFFPEFLQGGYTLTYLSVVFCVIAIILSNMTMKISAIWKTICLITLTISVLLLLLNLYQLM
jgi:hypothetical protein